MGFLGKELSTTPCLTWSHLGLGQIPKEFQIRHCSQMGFCFMNNYAKNSQVRVLLANLLTHFALVCLCSPTVKYISIFWELVPFVFSQFCLTFHSLLRISHSQFQKARWPLGTKFQKFILRFVEIEMNWSLAQSEIWKVIIEEACADGLLQETPSYIGRATSFQHKISRFIFEQNTEHAGQGVGAVKKNTR